MQLPEREKSRAVNDHGLAAFSMRSVFSRQRRGIWPLLKRSERLATEIDPTDADSVGSRGGSIIAAFAGSHPRLVAIATFSWPAACIGLVAVAQWVACAYLGAILAHPSPRSRA